VKFGLAYANTIPFTDPEPATDLVVAAEEAGFESVWTVEHVIWPRDYDSVYPYHPTGKMPGTPDVPIPDPLIWLTWVAAATSRIRLGTGVMILPLRNPLVLAKELATLDHLSGGRMELGIGAGWLEEEFEAVGVPFGGRGKRVDETIDAMRRLWADRSASFAGEVFAFDDVALNPKPVGGAIPIVVGGQSNAAIRRAAARGDGFYPGPDSIEELERIVAVLREQCAASGRDFDEIEISAAFPGRFLADPGAAVQVMADIGVDRLMVPAYPIAKAGIEAGMSAMAEIIAEVGPTGDV
jgi:probable F420-dependent oxidoreductase